MIPVETPEIDIDQPYVVCASGSAFMNAFLPSAGFDAYSVADRTSGWARSGRPVVGGSAPRASEPIRPVQAFPGGSHDS